MPMLRMHNPMLWQGCYALRSALTVLRECGGSARRTARNSPAPYDPSRRSTLCRLLSGGAGALSQFAGIRVRRSPADQFTAS